MNSRIRKAFDILELEEHATLEEAKRAWRDLAQVWHPDRHQYNERIQAKATEKLKDINRAWNEVQKWFAQQEQNENDQTDKEHEEQRREWHEADYKTHTCPHCATINRLPQNKPIESARCGKCAKFLSVEREREESLKNERADREQREEKQEQQRTEEARREALRQQEAMLSKELEELRLRQSAQHQRQVLFTLVVLILLVLSTFFFNENRKNENRADNGPHATEQAHAVSNGTILVRPGGAERIGAGQDGFAPLSSKTTQIDSEIVIMPSHKTEVEDAPVSDNIKAEIINVVKTWNLAKDKHDTDALAAVYAENIKFYGMNLRKERVMKDTELFFKENPSFTQDVVGDIHISEKGPGVYLAEFNKAARLANNYNSYEAYLVVTDNKAEGRLLIVTEGDKTTDRNLARREYRRKAR